MAAVTWALFLLEKQTEYKSLRTSTLFGRSSALGSIVVQGWGLLRIFYLSLIFFLQLCQYHPFCHYFCGVRGDGYFSQSGCIEAFY